MNVNMRKTAITIARRVPNRKYNCRRVSTAVPVIVIVRSFASLTTSEFIDFVRYVDVCAMEI